MENDLRLERGCPPVRFNVIRKGCPVGFLHMSEDFVCAWIHKGMWESVLVYSKDFEGEYGTGGKVDWEKELEIATEKIEGRLIS